MASDYMYKYMYVFKQLETSIELFLHQPNLAEEQMPFQNICQKGLGNRQWELEIRYQLRFDIILEMKKTTQMNSTWKLKSKCLG